MVYNDNAMLIRKRLYQTHVLSDFENDCLVDALVNKARKATNDRKRTLDNEPSLPGLSSAIK
jgi:hypothetical protein